MEGVAVAALITAVGAVVVAGLGWYVQQSHGLPSDITKSIRAELEKAIEIEQSKSTRLESELTAEKLARIEAERECQAQITRLAAAIVDRDVVIDELHRRLGLPTPQRMDPRRET